MKTYYAGLVFIQLCIYYFCGIRRIDILAEHLVPRGIVDIFDGLKWTTGEARIFTPPVDFSPHIFVLYVHSVLVIFLQPLRVGY